MDKSAGLASSRVGVKAASGAGLFERTRGAPAAAHGRKLAPGYDERRSEACGQSAAGGNDAAPRNAPRAAWVADARNDSPGRQICASNTEKESGIHDGVRSDPRSGVGSKQDEIQRGQRG